MGELYDVNKPVKYIMYKWVVNSIVIKCPLLVVFYQTINGKWMLLISQFGPHWVSHNCDFIVFTNPSARAEYDTRSIFKRSLTGLNSDFSFSWTSCLNKAEEPVCPTIYP